MNLYLLIFFFSLLQTSIDDYIILNILGNNINSASYKVQNKLSKEIFVWRTIDYGNINSVERKQLFNKITTRIKCKHPNLLQFFDIIDQKQSNILYVVTEFCENGNLCDLIEVCVKRRIRLNEEFVCKVLYQIISTIKTCDQLNLGHFTPEDVYLDSKYNVRLYNFQESLNHKEKELKTSVLGALMYEMCTLQCFEKTSYEKQLKTLVDFVYSANFLSLITHMIRDNNDLKKSIDKILCHPTVLLKSSQWQKHTIFHIKNKPPGSDSQSSDDGKSLNNEMLRNWEMKLKIREQTLYEKELQLQNREKQIAVREKLANDKITQAENCLKKYKEKRSTAIKETSSKDFDSTFYSEACEKDSIILPTSTKMMETKVKKPAAFSRSTSERKIRFKGHSPLKDIHNKTNKSLRKSSKSLKHNKPKSVKEDEGCKILFTDENQYENTVVDRKECRPISWTEENKKFAFDLLRMMNESQIKPKHGVKHTFL